MSLELAVIGAAAGIALGVGGAILTFGRSEGKRDQRLAGHDREIGEGKAALALHIGSDVPHPKIEDWHHDHGNKIGKAEMGFASVSKDIARIDGTLVKLDEKLDRVLASVSRRD